MVGRVSPKGVGPFFLSAPGSALRQPGGLVLGAPSVELTEALGTILKGEIEVLFTHLSHCDPSDLGQL